MRFRLAAQYEFMSGSINLFKKVIGPRRESTTAVLLYGYDVKMLPK